MSEYPLFLDCEASSLSSYSYPIEIAWSDEAGDIESHLINPYLYPDDYTDWDPSAQAVHGLSRAYLMENGESTSIVAERMNKVLAGKTLYTDAPDFDSFWVHRLFKAVGINRQFGFAHVDTLLMQLLPVEYWFSDLKNGQRHISELMKEAREQTGLAAHRASHDVAYLIQLYKLAKKV